ncbi:MAG: hypothetical protein Q7R72_00545 [bacterium]|nr:hypothetical protein [bacterium]
MENKTGDNKENKKIESQDESSRAVLSLFGENFHFVFVYKKTEKLIAAIYMITNYVRDDEPLKWRLREDALELLSLNIAFVEVPLSERRKLLKKYKAISVEIISLAGIAFHGGLISEMNHTVLKREFENLLSVMERDENRKANEENIILTPDFFGQTHKSDAPVSTVPQIDFLKKHNDVLYTSPRNSLKGHFQKTSVPDIDLSRTEQKTEYLPKIPIKSDKSFGDKDDRKTVIIKLLSKKGRLNIKDFSQTIKGCSEKTIQRELLAMVASGVLRKEGERRWSTYSLADR